MLQAAILLLLAVQDPLAGQLPKRDLGVDAFLAANPDYDGRGIRVAVLDTGIDPGHPFLQATPDGRRKLVDWYDATTDGRVDLSQAQDAQDGALIGLSGRRLTLGAHAGAGSYRLGRVDLAFLPPNLQGRIRQQRREAWEKGRERWSEAVARLEAAGESGEEETLAESETRRRWESFRDSGPVYDLVVYDAGDGLRAVLDADEDGDLGEEPALADFRDSGDWATLGDEALMNWAIGLDAGTPDEAVLFFDAHGHGTHVAGIIGSWDGEGSRLNGIAPGVELVAIKIGDGKFGGSTSGFAIAKALDYAVEAGCQVANMSFGGPSFYADGNEPDAWVIREATRRGLILVTSAGNEGPALTTVGAPATVKEAMSVAAAVWPDTQKVNYGSLEPSPPVLFDFSSRGPLPTGALGVDFTAPGAALSALPSWTLTKGENWNGTSMAAPQTAGVVALLRGAALAEGLAQSPARIERAMMLSATKFPQHAWVEVGHGFPDVGKALEHLRALDAMDFAEQEWQVTARNQFGDGAGIYVRGWLYRGAGMVHETTVNVAPLFPDGTSNADKAEFLRTFRLVSESDWVQVPEAVYANSSGTTFPVRIDLEKLAAAERTTMPASQSGEGGLASTRILLFDADRPDAAGAELVVPVTIVTPRAPRAGGHLWSGTLGPGELARLYVEVPYGATQAVVRVEQKDGARNEYRPGAGSVSGFRYAEDRQQRGRFLLEAGDVQEAVVPVEAGTIFEYALAARWAVNSPAELEVRIDFRGVVAQHDTWTVPAGQDTAYLGLKAPLDSTTVSVRGGVEGVAIPVVADMHIVPDPIRATVMGGKGMFHGIVEWQTDIPAGGAPAVLHMPRSIQTIELREDLMLEIFDPNGQVLSRHIAYEVDTDLGRLGEGPHRFRLTYPSIGTDALEARFAGAELRLATTTKSFDGYATLEAAMAGSGPGARLSIPKGGARSVFARVPELPALPPGQYYYGSARVVEGDATLLTVPIRVERPGGLPTGHPQEAPAGEEQAAAEGDAAEDAAAGDAAAEDPAVAARSAWQDAMDGDAGDVARVAAARAWQEAAPLDPRATLAVCETLARAGHPELAREEAETFLARFPAEADLLLEAAASWD